MHNKGFLLFLVLFLIVVPVSATTTTFRTAAGNDGQVGAWGSHTFYAIRAHAGEDASSATYANNLGFVGTSTSNQYDEFYRVILLFDTSSIPDTDTISSVKLGLYGNAKSNGLGSLDVGVTEFSPTSWTGSFVMGDYQRYKNVSLLSSNYTYSSISTTSWNNATGNSAFISAINKTGWTALMVRFTNDMDNSTTGITWANGAQTEVRFEDVGDGNAPLLEVVHSSGGSAPVTAFAANATSGSTPLKVGFTDSTTNTPTNWDWYWYANETKSSDDQNPQTSLTTGTYNVRLYTSNAYGGDWENKTGYIVVASSDPYASYIPPSISGAEPLTVQFTDISWNTPTSWKWNRTALNGTTSTFATTKNATQTFYAGNWSIQLGTTNADGSNTSRANVAFVNVTGVSAAPTASFSCTPNSSESTSMSVTCTDSSTGSPTSWLWERKASNAVGPSAVYTTFSTSQNPTSTFEWYSPSTPPIPGVPMYWSVRLTVTNTAGSSTSTMTNYIYFAGEEMDPPVADFTPEGELEFGIYIIEVQEGQTITFEDISSGDPWAWRWVFQTMTGNEEYFTQDVSFTFNSTTWVDGEGGATGAVQLHATNDAGTDTQTKYIRMLTDSVTPIAGYQIQSGGILNVNDAMASGSHIDVGAGDHVQFSSISLNYPTSLTWYFEGGNGTTYTVNTGGEESTEFMWASTTPSGYYDVTMVATNSAGTDTIVGDGVIHLTDIVAPGAVTSLTNTSASPVAIVWNWTNPTDTDIDHYVIWQNGVWYENVTSPAHTTTWLGLTPSTRYNISIKAEDTAGNRGSFTNATVNTTSPTWTYTASGTTTITIPVGVTAISLDMWGGGGSGRAACLEGSMSGSNYIYDAGGGGTAGSKTSISNIAVTEGSTYNLYVAPGGADANVTDPTSSSTCLGNAGGTSTATFGSTTYTAAGGATGLRLSGFLNGGDGQNGTTGLYPTTRFARNGSAKAPKIAGVAGLGPAAGGGGAAGNQSTVNTYSSSGGRGANGTIIITVYGYASGNRPDFVADRVTGQAGTLIHFTDLSTLMDSSNLSYTWSWGDGTTSNVTGDTVHVFSYTGSYDVSLSITTTNDTVTEYKSAYINIISQSTIVNPPSPQTVSFKVFTGLGTPISDVNVSVIPISTSTGDWDWIAAMFNIDMGETPISTTSMYQTTDSFGTASFIMIPTTKYNVSFTKTGYSIPPLIVTISEGTTEYWQYAASTGFETYEAGFNELQAINLTIKTVAVNSTHSYITMNYTDATGTTSGGYVDVIQKSNDPHGANTTLTRWFITSSSANNSLLVTHQQAVEGKVVTNINVTALDDPVVRTYPYSFRGAPVSFMGFGQEIALLVALGLMLMTTMLAGATHGRQIVVVMAVEGWIFYSIGWFAALVTRGVPEANIQLSLVLITVMALAVNLVEWRRRNP